MGRGQGPAPQAGPQNWLLRDPTEEELRTGVGAAAAAALSLPAAVGSAASAYGIAPGTTATQTSVALQVELARVATLLAAHADKEQALEWTDLELIHEAVFRPDFGSHAASS
jgi:hypothetical protein